MSSLLSRLLIVALAGGISVSVLAADPPKAAAPAAAAKPAAAAPAAAAPAAAAPAAPKPAAAPVDLTSPVGVWHTIDDETKKPRSQIRITETNGVINGTIEKLLAPDADQNAVCSECADDDDRKGKKVVGMTILRGLKKDGDVYSGGKILDPGKGKVYTAKITLIDGGKKLEMRGSIGPFGRTQTWVRVQ